MAKRKEKAIDINNILQNLPKSRGSVRKNIEQSEEKHTQHTGKLSKTKMEQYLSMIAKVRKEIKKTVVGQDQIVDGFLRGILANGHCLVEGVPGIAKTLIIRSLGEVTGCKVGRIQFTVDLLPTDIIGLTTLSPNKSEFEVLKGPIFANFVIADEVNRAPPKTQSALLEAMAERQVTISRESYGLSDPFFVMATQNPVESAGTYPLPEAQQDRFLFKLLIGYPEREHEMQIIEQNIALKGFDDYKLQKIMHPDDIVMMQKGVKQIQHTPRINSYIVDIVGATRNPKKYGISLGKYISLGSSPRASIALFIAGKADAFLNGQDHVTPGNIKAIAADVLRHRLLLNYRAQIDNVTADDVIKEILAKVRIP